MTNVTLIRVARLLGLEDVARLRVLLLKLYLSVHIGNLDFKKK